MVMPTGGFGGGGIFVTASHPFQIVEKPTPFTSCWLAHLHLLYVYSFDLLPVIIGARHDSPQVAS